MLGGVDLPGDEPDGDPLLGGATDGQGLIDAMKGMSWTSVRGPVTIDPDTRDIIQNVYVRKVEKRDGALWNVEFATIEAVKDPVKAAK